jgi:DNA-binding response OmpR family regulator
VDVADNGENALRALSVNDYDLLLLDLNLPDVDGLKICSMAREKQPSLLILILSARGNKEDIVKGLNSGADDFLVKPFHFNELLARIRALLRRDMRTRDPILKIQDVGLDTVDKVVWQSNQKIHLTKKEFGILEYMMQHPNEVVSQEDILEHVWGSITNPFTNTVRVHIQSLRMKLGDNPESPTYIETVIGLGYRFMSAETSDEHISN